MKEMSDNTEDFNSHNLFVFFYRWRKPLISLTLVGTLVAVIVSLLIQNKYKSTVILFPTTTSSISKAVLSENIGSKNDILKFGEEEEAEQMMQVLNSDEIRDKIIDKYNLMHHYDIDDDEKYKYTKLQKKFNNNVTFERTQFMSVEINVLDHDPDTAALIANDIAAFLDTVKNRMRREIAMEAFNIVREEYNDQQQYIKEMEDSLLVLRKLGVIDYESQAERLTEQMGIAILQGKSGAARNLEERLEVLGRYGGAYVSIRDELEYEKKQLTFLHSKYEEAKVDAEKNLQHKFVVNKAFPAEKKSYPIRWLIVLSSAVATFLVTLIVILFIDSIRSIKPHLSDS